MITPLVSVIIPSLHAPGIAATLASLQAQSLRERIGEILVVGLDGPGLVVEDGLVRLISTGIPASSPRARNIGMALARHELLALIDADCVADRAWLATLLARVEEGHSVVGSGVTFGADGYWTQADNLSMFAEFLSHQPAGPHPMLPSIGMLLRREVFERVGGMDERYPRAHDIDWTIRMRQAGYQLFFEPAAVVRHHPPRVSQHDMLRHWWVSGYDMAIVRRRYASEFGGSWLLRNSLGLIALAPLLALLTTLRTYRRAIGHPACNPRLFPAVYLSKIAWCLGGSRSLARLKNQPAAAWPGLAR